MHPHTLNRLKGGMTAIRHVIVLTGFLLCGNHVPGAVVAHAQEHSTDAVVATDAPTKVRHMFNVMIPMRDGIRLAADVQLPEKPGKYPVIVVRTPYGKYSKAGYEQAEYFARRGYVYVNQDVRGRFDSEGDFQVLVNEGRDGYDTIEWLARQPWSDGNVGTFGGSYSAWDQWLAAEEQPPHLRAMVVQATPPDIFLTAWWNGAFNINELFWCALVEGRVNQELSMYADPKIPLHLPVINMDEALGRRLEKTFRAWIEHPVFDEFWQKQAYQSRLSRVRVPVLHLDGWYDIRDVSATLQNYNTLIANAATPAARESQRVLIGPWWHGQYDTRKWGGVDFGSEAVIDRKSVYLQWYDCYLKNKNCDEVTKQAPVKIFVMGVNQWRDEQKWPPQRARVVPYFFHSKGHANTRTGDGVLSVTPPPTEPPDQYSYNPQDPPTLSTGADDSLAADQRQPESRTDMLVFTSEPMDAPLQVAGHITVKLWASTSAQDTDWVARLIDVHPDGFAQRLTDTIVRASYRGLSSYPKSPAEFAAQAPGIIREYTLNLGDLANVFMKGHRVRVEITSGFMPLFSRNLNTGQNSLTTVEMKIAEQTIYHDRNHPSQILLHVIPE
jgi:uncharacterized protein